MTPARPDIEARRRMVASLMLRGHHLDAITDGIAGHFINPRTQKPYSRDCVVDDMHVLKARWREGAAADIAELRGRQLAEIEALKQAAWSADDLSEVRMLLDREARLLGLDAPTRIDVVGLARSIAEAAARMAGMTPEEIAAVGARAAELAV
jgi:hypothetical protein